MREGSPTFTGSTKSIPYVRLNNVSLVVSCGEDYYPQSTYGSSYTQSPIVSLRRRFNSATYGFIDCFFLFICLRVLHETGYMLDAQALVELG